jgi:hypothetical protein
MRKEKRRSKRQIVNNGKQKDKQDAEKGGELPFVRRRSFVVVRRSS